VSPDRGGDDELEAEQKLGEVTPPKEEVDPLNKRKVSPPETFFLEEIESHHDQDVDYPHLR
jgi:hypothetical protein